MDNDSNRAPASTRQKRDSRADSLIREGTGRYAEDLGNCIANEKGLLKKEDFNKIQQIIEVYSKALLAKMRNQHLQERKEAFISQDWSSYASIIAKQQAKEVKVFNGATLEVLSEADIKVSVFNQSVELHMILSHDSML